MNYETLMSILRETGLPFAYDHFAEGESPAPPFICFLFPGSNNFSADGKVFLKATEVRVELYTDEKNPEIEEAVEAVFDRYEIYYDKSEVWIDEERLYEVMYSFEIPWTNDPDGSEMEETDAE